MMEREHDNFRAAMTTLDKGDSLLRITKSLYWFWNVRGYWTEGRERLEHALQLETACAKTRADCLNGLGILAWRQGDYTRARQAFEEGIALQEELPAAARARRRGDDPALKLPSMPRSPEAQRFR